MHRRLAALAFGASLGATLSFALPAALCAQPLPPAGGEFVRAERDTLPARWARPFAVEVLGGIARRSPRTSVVRATPTSAPAPTAAAPVPSATAARPAPAPPAPPARPTSTTPERAAVRSHEVVASETFLAVARRYGVSYSALLAANPGLDPERIRPGQVLRLPAGPRTHLVVRGETLFGIARRYGVEPERIRAANRLTDDKVKIGQTLVIPAK